MPIRESFRACLAVLLCCSLCTTAQPGPAQSLAQSAPQSPSRDGAPTAASSAIQPALHGRRPEYKSDQMQGDERILHALNRFTFGPRPGDLEAVRAMGLEQWFESQLHPASLDETELDARLAQFPAMQWSTENLLYRMPSNAVIRQAMNGRESIPQGPILRAVYENQIYRLQEKRADQAQKQPNPAQNMQPGAQDQGQSMAGNSMSESSPGAAPMAAASNSDAGMPGDAPATAPVPSATILNQLDQLTASAERPASDRTANPGPATGQATEHPAGPANDPAADSTFDQGQLADLLALAPPQRIAKLAAMQPADFDAFFKSLRPPQRARLVADMRPELRETVADLENPQRLLGEELMSDRLARDIYSNAQLEEVMTDFWLNHFNVYLRKNEETPYYLVSYERDVIRPRALGKFEDLLEAVAHSPAMLLYLDNAESVGPDSPAAERARFVDARRPANQRKAPEGINENYARELMELHTLGVNGGYTQADVIQAARVLTGWTVDRPQRGGAFIFNPNRHEPGTKKVLGKKIKENGEREGEELLHLLATRPAAAQFISRKLAIRFVSDDPPQALVDRMAKTYLSSGGDISAVMRTLFRSPEFWTASDYRAKVKTPIEFVVSAVRAGNAEIVNYLPLENALRQMGMPLYGCIPPTGYKWDEADWVSTGALVDRMNFALNLAANRLPGITVNWTPYSGNAGMAANAEIPTPEAEEARLEPLLVAGGVSPATRSAALKQFEAQSAQDPAPVRPMAAAARPFNRGRAASAVERQDQVLAGLLIGSPEFQRR